MCWPLVRFFQELTIGWPSLSSVSVVSHNCWVTCSYLFFWKFSMCQSLVWFFPRVDHWLTKSQQCLSYISEVLSYMLIFVFLKIFDHWFVLHTAESQNVRPLVQKCLSNVSVTTEVNIKWFNIRPLVHKIDHWFTKLTIGLLILLTIGTKWYWTELNWKK